MKKKKKKNGAQKLLSLRFRRLILQGEELMYHGSLFSLLGDAEDESDER